MVASARIRLFVVKNDDGFEELNHETFDNRLVSFKTMRTQSSNNTLNDLLEMESEDFNFDGRLTGAEWVESNILYVGLDGIKDSIVEILEAYQAGDVIEILADYCIETHGGRGMWESDDYEEDEWLENVESNKLSSSAVTKFIGRFEIDSDGCMVFLEDKA